MYDKILLTLDTSAADRPMIDHVKELAALMNSRVVLLHVAKGPAAQFHRENAAGEEIEQSQAYLKQIRLEFEASGISAIAELGFGEPVREIVKWVNEKGCDLVAMGTHGHRLLGDLVFGATASHVQHSISVPVLLLRAK